MALTSLISHVVSPVSHFSVALTTYKQDRIAFRRFAEFLSLPDDLGLQRGSALTLRDGAVVFDGVSFAYGDRPVIDDLTVTLGGGRTTALVGPSGAGKSTLVQLLLHLIKPDGGRIMVDGQDLADVSLESFYRQVAYIPQELPVFDGTIRENIVFDAPVDEVALQDVVAQAGLSDLVTRLPQGLETVVGERGIKLSGGERQRLAFARLMVQQPRIVVMDEPTSSLDSLTEAVVTRNLADFLARRTVLVIAHRLQTV